MGLTLSAHHVDRFGPDSRQHGRDLARFPGLHGFDRTGSRGWRTRARWHDCACDPDDCKLAAVATPTREAAPSEQEQRATTIVLIGRFNPRIFQPMWFAARKLLAEGDVDPESIVVTDGVSAFRTHDISILCSLDRCQVGTTPATPTPDILRDLVTETFSLLAETPIGRVGINHQAHVPSSESTWDTVAAQLGDPHRRFVLLENQRLATVELRGDRDDKHAGSRSVHLQPSVVLEDGVWLQLNDHIDVADRPENAIGAKDAVDALTDIWDSSKAVAEHVLRQIAPHQ